MIKDDTKRIEKLTYEEAYAELEIIVTALESGEQSLEDALSHFERGQMLTRHCMELLEKAELKVRTYTDEALEDQKVGA